VSISSITSSKKQPCRAEILFRSLCAVGWSLQKHLQDLRSVCDQEGLKSWMDIIEDINIEAVQSYERQANSKEANHLTAWAQLKVEVLVQFYKNRADPASLELSRVLQEIADDIVFADLSQLKKQFDEVNQRAYQLAQQYIESYGGTHAKEHWKSCQLAPIEFEKMPSQQSFCPVTSIDNNKKIIKIQFGAQGGYYLLSYLILEFQLFHEYISHIFPIWDNPEKGRTFSEAYLFYLELYFYRQDTSKQINFLLVSEEEKYRLRYYSEEQDRVWRSSREQIEYLCHRKWLTHERACFLLLELAAIDENIFSSINKHRFLAMLNQIYKVDGANKWNQNEKTEIRRLLAQPTDLQEIHDRLRDRLRPDNLYFR
jgi:hypothetical protein